MPRFKKYEWETQEEEKDVRRKNDRERKLIKYWRNKYNLDVTFEQLETFMKYKCEIKRVLPILDFVKTLEFVKDSEETEEIEESQIL